MKLHPPTPEIPPDDPYANDLFDRREFGESLTSLFRNVEENAVIAVDAPWGDGKTTFARMWIADLKQSGKQCIYFDAYEHDYSDDPFVSFCAEIVALSESTFGENDSIRKLKEEFVAKAKRVGGKMFWAAARVGVKAVTGGIVGDSELKELAEIKGQFTSGAFSSASALFQEKLEDCVSARGDVGEFRQKLSALGAAIRQEQEFPLVIVVDELDRCRPDFALALIERVKHLFTADNVSFLLLVNMKQLENYVKTVYGAEVDARSYLQKFITLSVTLPSNRQDPRDNDYVKYCLRLAEHYGIGAGGRSHDILPALFQDYEFTLREMERCFSILSIYYSQLPRNRLTDGCIIAFLAVVRIRFPDVFEKLAVNQLSYQSFVSETMVEKIERSDHARSLRDFLLENLKLLLLSDEKYDALDSAKRNRLWEESPFFTKIERKQVIPFLCAELSRFRLAES